MQLRLHIFMWTETIWNLIRLVNKGYLRTEAEERVAEKSCAWQEKG